MVMYLYRCSISVVVLWEYSVEVLQKVVHGTPYSTTLEFCTVYAYYVIKLHTVRVRVNSSVCSACHDRVRVSNQEVVETGYSPSTT
jgi:hypothetical protein